MFVVIDNIHFKMSIPDAQISNWIVCNSRLEEQKQAPEPIISRVESSCLNRATLWPPALIPSTDSLVDLITVLFFTFFTRLSQASGFSGGWDDLCTDGCQKPSGSAREIVASKQL